MDWLTGFLHEGWVFVLVSALAFGIAFAVRAKASSSVSQSTTGSLYKLAVLFLVLGVTLLAYQIGYHNGFVALKPTGESVYGHL